MRLDNVERLDAGQLSAVIALSEAAAAVDHVTPLSEQVLLAARDGSSPGSAHFLAQDGTHLSGYAHLARGPAGEASTAEVVVDPADRRRGVGTALIRALEAVLEAARDDHPEAAFILEVATARPDAATLQIWSHGHLDGARTLAARDGYSAVRELWAMGRSLRSDVDPQPADLDSLPAHADLDSLPARADPLPEVRLPEGFRSRPFVVGQDEDAWLGVNARAFADHAEQGLMTRHDLDLRIAEPWFDATGFILIEDTRGAAPTLAASHWTKVVPAAEPAVSPTQGEVYVVGVDPAYQGLGLGRAVTVLGLAHLRERGLTQAMLYVDADNTAAVATYSRLGFTPFGVDVMYSHAVHSPVPR